MCLGIPMRVDAIAGVMAHCSAKGVTREVSLFLLRDQSVEPGDFVLVHVGYAIQTVSDGEAESLWSLFDQMLAEEDNRRA